MSLFFETRKGGRRGYVTCFRRGEAVFDAKSLASRDHAFQCQASRDETQRQAGCQGLFGVRFGKQ